MTARPGPRQRGYDGKWQRARAAFLAAHPACVMCAREGKTVRAVHVHHATPHRGDRALFWDRTKWVGLCAEHHNRDAQQVETKGYATRLRADGVPSDPSHPFNRGGPDEPSRAEARHGFPQGTDGASSGDGGRVKSDAIRGRGPHGSRSAELVSEMTTARPINSVDGSAT